MINQNDRFEDIISKILDISAVPDLIEIQINGLLKFYVYDIYLDDFDESDAFSFDWVLNKPFRLQTEKTQQVLKLIINE